MSSGAIEGDDVEYLKRAIKHVQDDNQEIRKTLDHTNRRVDELSEGVVEISNGLAKIEGCMQPLCDNVKSITDAVVKNGLGSGGDKTAIMTEIIRAVKLLIVVSVIATVVGMFGFYKMDTSVKHKDSEIKINQTVGEPE